MPDVKILIHIQGAFQGYEYENTHARGALNVYEYFHFECEGIYEGFFKILILFAEEIP